ncbi:MAG: hypothetical protein VKJ64_08905 [Leptolyngbyaceae bacterium]|nr:hypothetical protein [Leptolyngbyaceae bacterium]
MVGDGVLGYWSIALLIHENYGGAIALLIGGNGGSAIAQYDSKRASPLPCFQRSQEPNLLKCL